MDGSADVPWGGISGPAVLSIRCTTLSEHLAREIAMSCGDANRQTGYLIRWDQVTTGNRRETLQVGGTGQTTPRLTY